MGPRRMIREIPRWIFMGRSGRIRRTNRKAIRKRLLARKGLWQGGQVELQRGIYWWRIGNGLIVSSLVWRPQATAERDAAMVMLGQLPDARRVTVGGDKGFGHGRFCGASAGTWA